MGDGVLPTRRHLITIEAGNDQFKFMASVGFHPKTGAPCEVFFTGRAKPGSALDDALYDLGVKISKAMQGKG